MATAAHRERQRESVRSRFIEAARDLLSEHGLDAVSMRAIAERVEYSPGTIYLYFRDKDELVTEVVKEGFARMHACVERELLALPACANAADQFGAMGLAYARFAVEHPAYFRVMFELPGSACFECPAAEAGEERGGHTFGDVIETVRRASEGGLMATTDARRTALIGWGLIHGLTSLYLSGHLAGQIRSHDDFLALVEEAMRTMGVGWRTGVAE